MSELDNFKPNKIIIKNGQTKPNTGVLDVAELGFATSTRKVYVGATIEHDNGDQEKVIVPVTGTTVNFDEKESESDLIKYFIDAQKLGGLEAENYATKDYVTEKINEASIGGGGGGGSVGSGNADTLDGYHANDFAFKTDLESHNSSEDSHPDIRELISKAPDGIYKQNDEPIDAPEGALWLDLDANPSGGGGGGVPAVTEEDEGKFLRVVNGEWAAVLIPQAEEGEF